MFASWDELATTAVVVLVLAFAAWTLVRAATSSGEGAQPGPGAKLATGGAGVAKVAVASPAPRPAVTVKDQEPGAAPSSVPQVPPSIPEVTPSLETLPTLSEPEGEDDAEVTQVTVSPLKEAAPAGAPPEEERAESLSKVEVIFEEEAEIEEITSPSARILVSASAQSDKGRVRRNNEDSLLVLAEHSLFVVADGMGGYKGGEIASALAVDTLKESFEKGAFDGETRSPFRGAGSRWLAPSRWPTTRSSSAPRTLRR
jgi:hypothetical protein